MNFRLMNEKYAFEYINSIHVPKLELTVQKVLTYIPGFRNNQPKFTDGGEN